MTNPPKLKRKLEVKKYHGLEIKDEFSWVHQNNILEVLKDSSKSVSYTHLTLPTKA